MKQIKVADEFGLPWTFIKGDELYAALDTMKLGEEYACWRDHLLIGLDVEGNVAEARQRLCDAEKGASLETVIHAARCFTLLTALPDAQELVKQRAKRADVLG